LKQHGRAAAALIRLVQQYRRQASPEAPQGDLNEAITAAVAAVRAGALPTGVQVAFTPHDGLRAVRAGLADLKRLFTFLLGNATLSGCREVAVRTEAGGGGVSVVVDVTGPTVDPTFVARLSAPALSARDGAAGLELAAARSLVRRLGGNFSAEANDSGVRVAVELACG
jgi:C4-dicarboxylate-specific signal transduction histidine kinase